MIFDLIFVILYQILVSLYVAVRNGENRLMLLDSEHGGCTYLIRAEARAKKSAPDLEGALTDLNKIRKRSHVPEADSDLASAIIGRAPVVALLVGEF